MPPHFKFSPRVFRLPLDSLTSAAPRGSDLDGHAVLARALRAFDADRRPVLLDSAAGWPQKYSLLAIDPLPPVAPDRFEDLRDFAAQLALVTGGDEVPGPFHGGFLGALAYDLGVIGERQALPAEPWCFPKIVGGLYTDFFVYREGAEHVELVLGDEPGDGRASVESRRAGLEARIRSALAAEAGSVQARAELVRHTPRSVHMANVEETRQRIARGEFYQANLAHRFTRSVSGPPAELYLQLRESNPAPYAGYLHWRDAEGREGALCSSSPELLLELTGERGERIARTRPIKGTTRRAVDAEEDRQRAEGLLASEKDRAELAMIVDLERNDLGRTAATGTVRVEDFLALRTYERVHHLTADVVAEPREGCDVWQILGALFPGGSVTGAPKLASMEAIAELEGEGRGFFCGSLGFVDTRGQACFNLLIRTVLWRSLPQPESSDDQQHAHCPAGEVSFRVGGGITWSSNAADEDSETLAKASAMMDAIESQSARTRTL